MLKAKNGRPMLLSKCAVCGGKKSRFMKEQKVKWLLSSLRFKTPLSKVPLLCDIKTPLSKVPLTCDILFKFDCV